MSFSLTPLAAVNDQGRVDADVSMLRKASRRRRCWLAVVEVRFTTGGSHVPLAAPTLLHTATIDPVREESSAPLDSGGVGPAAGRQGRG